MSADNWDICPKCSQGSEKLDEPETTMREDYELFLTEDGHFQVSYSAYCTKCKFSFQFNHEQQVPV
jgi:hypothetical protein